MRRVGRVEEVRGDLAIHQKLTAYGVVLSGSGDPKKEAGSF
jgi:hypothetical protein